MRTEKMKGVEQAMVNLNTHPYQRGFRFESRLSTGPDRKTATSVGAGPLEMWVAARMLTNEFLDGMSERIEKLGADMSASFDDFGASVHVCDQDGSEWLRFDCFANEPHYHYNFIHEDAQMICRIDEVAEGEPSAWMISRLRHRLPEMLEFAGANDLAVWARAYARELSAAVDEVESLLAPAAELAAELRQVARGIRRSGMPSPKNWTDLVSSVVVR